MQRCVAYRLTREPPSLEPAANARASMLA